MAQLIWPTSLTTNSMSIIFRLLMTFRLVVLDHLRRQGKRQLLNWHKKLKSIARVPVITTLTLTLPFQSSLNQAHLHLPLRLPTIMEQTHPKYPTITPPSRRLAHRRLPILGLLRFSLRLLLVRVRSEWYVHLPHSTLHLRDRAQLVHQLKTLVLR